MSTTLPRPHSLLWLLLAVLVGVGIGHPICLILSNGGLRRGNFLRN